MSTPFSSAPSLSFDIFYHKTFSGLAIILWPLSSSIHLSCPPHRPNIGFRKSTTTSSMSELRVLASRMRTLEHKADGLTAWPLQIASSISSQAPTPGKQKSQQQSQDQQHQYQQGLDQGDYYYWDSRRGSETARRIDEDVARWWRGVGDWWGDWAEVGRRTGGRAKEAGIGGSIEGEDDDDDDDEAGERD